VKYLHQFPSLVSKIALSNLNTVTRFVHLSLSLSLRLKMNNFTMLIFLCHFCMFLLYCCLAVFMFVTDYSSNSAIVHKIAPEKNLKNLFPSTESCFSKHGFCFWQHHTYLWASPLEFALLFLLNIFLCLYHMC
jgi:hypothetical protein